MFGRENHVLLGNFPSNTSYLRGWVALIYDSIISLVTTELSYHNYITLNTKKRYETS